MPVAEDFENRPFIFSGQGSAALRDIGFRSKSFRIKGHTIGELRRAIGEHGGF